MKYFSKFLSILLGIVAFQAGGPGSIPWAKHIFRPTFFSFFSFSSCWNHQTFLIRLATFKITQILSPERASERKGMSTVERLTWLDLYSLDLNLTFQAFVYDSLLFFTAKWFIDQQKTRNGQRNWIQVRYHSRFFVRVGHETTYESIGNNIFFTIPCHRQT